MDRKLLFSSYLIWKYSLNLPGLLLFSVVLFLSNETEPMDLKLSCVWFVYVHVCTNNLICCIEFFVLLVPLVMCKRCTGGRQ
jgi:hypothetical protein